MQVLETGNAGQDFIYPTTRLSPLSSSHAGQTFISRAHQSLPWHQRFALPGMVFLQSFLFRSLCRCHLLGKVIEVMVAP